MHQHTTDCMSEWAEARRDLMTKQTIEVNHRLHLADDFTDGQVEMKATNMYLAFMEEKMESQGLESFLPWLEIAPTSRKTWRERAYRALVDDLEVSVRSAGEAGGP